MRGIQNNLNQLQINQYAMEQAALQVAKKNQSNEIRSQVAEEILKQQDQKENAAQTHLKTSSTYKDGKKEPSFKNYFYSKDGSVQNGASELPPENIPPAPISHIDFKV